MNVVITGTDRNIGLELTRQSLVFHPSWVRSSKVEWPEDLTVKEQLDGKFWPWEAAGAAADPFIEDSKWEDRLVLRDCMNTELSW